MKGGDDALHQVRELLAGDQFPLNARLPPERELAETLGISRRRLREALSLLEAEGAIWRHVGKGTFVGDRPITDMRDLLVISGSTSPTEVLEVREYLEPIIAGLAAIRATDKDIAAMQRAIKRSETTSDVRAYEVWDGTLHRAIAIAAHNSLLVALFDAVNAVRTQTAWGKLQSLALSRQGQRVYWEQHRKIVDAIAGRDAASASRIARVHIETVKHNMFEPAAEAEGERTSTSPGRLRSTLWLQP